MLISFFCIFQAVVALRSTGMPGGMRRSISRIAISEERVSESAVVDHENNSPVYMLIATSAVVFLGVDSADAIEGPLSLLAGRSASMLHPLTNLALFGSSIYAAYLGFQWRRLREIGDEIKQLNKQLPQLSTGTMKLPIADSITSLRNQLATMGTEDAMKQETLQSDLRLMQSVGPIDAQIAELAATRKQLLSMDLKNKHEVVGSILLGVGVSVSLLGCLNTFLRAGKLFPGPHLYAGAGITILWALAAALVPFMQKGNESARSAHIALNTINIALFTWQVATGMIVDFLSFPSYCDGT